MLQEAELVIRVPQTHTIDAKAVFNVLKKEAAGSKQDRRAALDLAIIQESLFAPMLACAGYYITKR